MTKPDHAAIPPLRDECASDSILARDTTTRLVSGYTWPSTELWYCSWNNLTSCIAYPDLLFMSQKMCSVPSQKLEIYSKLTVIFCIHKVNINQTYIAESVNLPNFAG